MKVLKHAFILIFVIAFSSYSFAQKKTTIKGKILNQSGSMVHMANIITEAEAGTATIEANGTFELETTIEETDFFRLSVSEEEYVILILHPGEKVELNWDVTKMLEPKIEGSPDSKLVYKTFDELGQFDKKLEELTAQIEKEKAAYIKTLVTENSKSLATLFFIDNLDLEQDVETYKKVSADLNSVYPDHSLVQDLNGKVNGASLLAIGSPAPEIDLPNPDGKNIKLSSLKGSYVLIDFWAAWCRPCRVESPNMVRMYNKFHDKGFEIYSVSLDQTKEDWVAAIEKDGLGAWPHVSDLQYWQSIAAREYGVDGIPFTVLLDKEGNIIAKGLRGDALESKLDEIFK